MVALKSHVAWPDLVRRALLAYVASFAAWTVFVAITGSADPFVATAWRMGCPLATVALCLWASRRVEGRQSQRWLWRLLALAQVDQALAQAAWGYMECTTPGPLSDPWLANIIWLPYYPIIMAALATMAPSLTDRFTRKAWLLDATLLSLGLIALAWQFVLVPFLAKDGEPASTFMAMAFVLVGAVVAIAVLALLVSMPAGRGSAFLPYLCAALTLGMGADVLYNGIFAPSGTYTGAHPLEALYALAYSMIGLGALATTASSQTTPVAEARASRLRRLTGARFLLPHLALPATVVALLAAALSARTDPAANLTIPTLAALGAGAVVALRQWLTVRRLAAVSVEAEALYRTSAHLSRAATSADVIVEGLSAACDAARATGGAVWLYGERGELVRAGSARLAEDRLAVMDELALIAGEATKEVPAGGPFLLIPLVARGHHLGVLGLVTVGDWSAGQRRLAQGLAAELGIALDNTRRYEEARHLADRDPLTGLYNHRYLHEHLAEATSRGDRGFAVMMLDLDGFKALNDTFGHPTGDGVLRQIATVLRRTARAGDALCRYGGDELAAVLQGADAAGAVSFAERLRAALAAEPFRTATGEEVPLHFSYGVAAYPQDGYSTTELLARADANLYVAKTASRKAATTTRRRKGTEPIPAALGSLRRVAPQQNGLTGAPIRP